MSKINHRPDCIDQSTCEGMIRSRDDAIAAQGRVLAELRAENDRLSGLMNGDVILKTVTYTREDGTQAEVQHWAVKLLAGSLLDTFKEFGGENFVTFTLNSSDGPLEVTIRPCWGGKKTAAEVLGELRAENERLRSALKAIRDQADGWINFVNNCSGPVPTTVSDVVRTFQEMARKGLGEA